MTKKNPFPLLANTQSFGTNSDTHKTTEVEGTQKINQIEVTVFYIMTIILLNTFGNNSSKNLHSDIVFNELPPMDSISV